MSCSVFPRRLRHRSLDRLLGVSRSLANVGKYQLKNRGDAVWLVKKRILRRLVQRNIDAAVNVNDRQSAQTFPTITRLPP